MATKYAASVSWLGGLRAGLPFIILFIVLIVTPRARLAERRVVTATAAAPQLVRAGRDARWWPAPLAIVFFCLRALLRRREPGPPGRAALVYVMLFLSLGLLVKTSGQISLCHLAFAAVGAAAFGHFAASSALPGCWRCSWPAWWPCRSGAIIAIPAIRLSGVFLALATYGFGILLEQMFYDTNLMFGPTTAGIAGPPAGRHHLGLAPLHRQGLLLPAAWSSWCSPSSSSRPSCAAAWAAS